MGTESKDIVAVRVTKHLPMGLGVEAEDGKPGIIRVREISWDPGHVAHWKELYPLGWTGEAYPLSVRKGSIQEFSLRLAESDPWEDVPSTIKRGQTYEGRVTGIVNYGAFVEIAAGITGLLHRSKLPSWAKSSPIELFWPGDRVLVNVQDIDYRDRKITLGFSDMTRPAQQANVTHELRSSGGYVDFEHEVEILLKQTTQKKNYMIVEDDPQQSMAMSSWLRHLNQRVSVHSDAESALLYLEKTTPDIAFLDIGLPGMSGLHLIRIILEKWPQIFLVITTDWTNAEMVMNELEELQQQHVELLVKPFLPEELIAVIRKSYSGEEPEHKETQEPGLANLLVEQPLTIRSNKLKKGLLDKLRRQLGFELAILFSIDKSHRQVSIVECSGAEHLLNPSVTPQLIYSPVRDVAEDQSSVVMNELQSHSRDRFRYLLELYPHLASCIGVPVTARIPADFALFVMDRHPHPISPEQKIYTEAIAIVLGTHLEQETFNERSRLIQRSALIGHLTRGMVHEINNLIAPLHSRLDNLQAHLKLMEKGQTPSVAADNGSLMDELLELQKNVRKIISTTRMFGRFTAKGKNEVLRVDEIVDETIHFMRDISEQAHVKITFDRPEHLLVIRNQAAALEQVLLNVLLNAVQQIAEFHPGTGGWVKVSIVPPMEKAEHPSFTILVEDSGPGIHVSLWERIFEAGYTTRADGSGIGLYISWNLMEESGGRIYVKDSHILSGTTFGLEIPYHL